MTVRALPTTEVSSSMLEEIHQLLVATFEGDFADSDWEHTVGGIHFIVEDAGVVVSHASVVPRTLEVDSRPFQVGYVEGVGTDITRHGEGFASAAMTAATAYVRSNYEMGTLGTDLFGFYNRFGWENWTGPTYVRRDGGLTRTADDDGYLMVLRFGPSATVDLSAPISCEDRSGDVW
ncbi:MAG: aminoglycoside 2-N-acetyltransferase [Actinomycetota bacterium]|jgi:aminoglycoside 2'-N-acetyltransferase I|nr:aminoglycoside 2-N-acetyltransferase [Actinomycetota bacterium]